MKEIGKM